MNNKILLPKALQTLPFSNVSRDGQCGDYLRHIRAIESILRQRRSDFGFSTQKKAIENQFSLIYAAAKKIADHGAVKTSIKNESLLKNIIEEPYKGKAGGI